MQCFLLINPRKNNHSRLGQEAIASPLVCASTLLLLASAAVKLPAADYGYPGQGAASGDTLSSKAGKIKGKAKSTAK